MTELLIFRDLDQLGAAWTRAFAERAALAVRTRGSCSLVLSGGRTPRVLYDRLARHDQSAVPWAQVHVYWGDERYVPPDHEASNYRMAAEALLRHVPVPAANVHRMPTEPEDPRDAAAAYERVLRSRFSAPWPRFDIVLLGLGEDGHTASLFPRSAALGETRRWVMATTGPSEPRTRLTLTFPAITHAEAIDVIVSGASKAEALRRALSGDPDPVRCPASGIRRTGARLVWWADAPAAALVRPGGAHDNGS